VPIFVNYKKGCTRLAAASDKVYQLLAHGRWFSPGTQASSTTKTGRNDIAEILLKVALNKINQINKFTNINKANNHCSPQTIEHKKYHDIWCWKSRDRHKNVAGLNRLIGSQPSFSDTL
jgi:hypothetical protein